MQPEAVGVGLPLPTQFIHWDRCRLIVASASKAKLKGSDGKKFGDK